jgi:hypothetical protein
MARLVFLGWLAVPATLFLAVPVGAFACGGAGGSTTGSTTSMAAARTGSAAATMSAARAVILSRAGMFRPYGGVNYGMSPGYMGSGYGYGSADSAMSSSPRMALRARPAAQSPPPMTPVAKPAHAADPAAPASNLDLPTRDWVITGENGDTVITAQYAGVIEASVILRKTDGKITLAPVDQLSLSDREYVGEQVGRKTAASVAKN